jgi:hypothetical protein
VKVKIFFSLTEVGRKYFFCTGWLPGHRKTRKPEGTVAYFLVWLLTYDLSGMEALPVAMLPPAQRSGSSEAGTSKL